MLYARLIPAVLVMMLAALLMAACGDEEGGVATTDDGAIETTDGTDEGGMGEEEMQVELTALNDSEASGTATLRMMEGNQLMVEIETEGLLDGSPHAQHIHIGGEGRCPDASADTDGDGVVSTAEGIPAYGEVQVSLTMDGDTGAESALAVDRFPTEGSITYSRTIEASQEVMDAVENGQATVVVHGIDMNDSGSYDGDAKSSLDPSLPLEATVPALCGDIS